MKKYVIGGAVILLGAIILCANTASTSSIEVGKKAPTFSLKDYNGADHPLD